MKGVRLWVLMLTVPLLAGACGGGAGKNPDLPENFPDDFPVYEGARPTEVNAIANQMRVRFEIEATRQQITDFYRQTLDRPPWHIVTAEDMVFEDESFLTFARDDNEISGSVGVVTNKKTGKANFVVAVTLR